MKLIVVYAILAAAGIAAAIGLGEIVEVTYPSASLLAFMGLFFVSLGVAWVAAVRVTGN
jgi:hypothetical protein